MDTNEKVSLLIQFALLTAGQEEDYRDRELRPIHLIKYVYLADLEYAKSHDGKTFTGIEWQFYKFGPYSNDVFFQIDPAANSIHATKKTLPSDYEDKKDWSCYSLINDTLLYEIDAKLPIGITLNLSRHIRSFTNNTQDLLHFVYNTPPMRHAAPLELLDFSLVALQDLEKEEAFIPYIEKLSKKQQLQKKKKLKEIRAILQKRKEEGTTWRETLVKPPHEPRYDEVFKEGVEWLDSLAGDSFQEDQIEVSFDKSVWKSPTRRMDDSY